MPSGKRRKHYTPEMLAEAVKAGMSIREAEAQFGVPHSMIRDRASGDHGSRIGHPPELTMEEENIIVDMVKLLCDWGFPFTGGVAMNIGKFYSKAILG